MKQTFSKKYAYPLAVCILFILIAGGLMWQARKKQQEPMERSGFLFDTVIAVSLYDHQEEKILDGVFSLCSGFEDQFSPTKEGSELWKMNHRGTGVTEWKTTEDVAAIIKKGLEYSRISGGAFDITVLPVSSLWDFRSGEKKLPDSAALKEALKEVDYRKVSVDGTTVRFADDQVQVDPGAVAKGYIADRLKEYLLSQGVTSAIINLGGNVLCVGKKPDGSPFKIAVRKPEKDSSEVVKVLDVTDLSTVSSGIYERCFDLDGVHYHHILDPKTGMPYQNGLSAVTIVGPSSLECDALSTTCFSLGETAGAALLDSMPDYCGYFIRTDGTLVSTEGAPD